MQVQQAVRVADRQTDACRSANLLVKRHGDEAPIFAAIEVDVMLERGNRGRRVDHRQCRGRLQMAPARF